MANLTILRYGGTDYGIGKPIDSTFTKHDESADSAEVGEFRDEVIPVVFNAKNLLKFVSDGFTQSGMTVTMANGRITLSGTASEGITIDSGLFKAILKPNKKYTFRILNPSGLNNNSAIYLMQGNTYVMSAALGANGQAGVTFTTPASLDGLFWRLYISSGATYSNAGGNLMLTPGETAPTSFVKYNELNVLTKEDAPDIGYRAALQWERGTITDGLDADNTSTNITNRFRTAEIVHIKKGSTIRIKNSNCNFYIYFYDGYHEKSYTETVSLTRIATTYTFEEDCFVRFLFYKYGDPVLYPSDVDDNFEFTLYQANDGGVDVWFIGSIYNVLGDCSVLKFPSGKVLMIDCWSEQEYYFSRAMWQAGVVHVDYFILSHYHADHMGNFHWLVENGYIDEDTVIYLPQALDTSATDVTSDWSTVLENYQSVLDDIETAGSTAIIPEEGDVFCVDGYPVQFWNVDHSKYYPGQAYASNNYNDFSLCNYVLVGNVTLGFSGDLGWTGQEKCASKMLKCHIYKAQHHGWDNDPNHLIPAYINRVVPDVVFSEDCSRQAGYIDTNACPMQTWCEANGVSNYRTYINGNMLVHVNKYGWRLDKSYTRYIRNGKNWSFSDNSEHIET